MADTFFNFDTSLNNGDHILPPDEDDCIENEEEYDALNDETFGGLEDASSLDDWEQQHEQFAEIAEISKHKESIENSISHLVDDEESLSPLSNSSVWSYQNHQNGELSNSILSSLQKASKSFIENLEPKNVSSRFNNLSLNAPKKICTVEELEKNLIKTSGPRIPIQNVRPLLPPPGHPPMPPYHILSRPPPGLPPMNLPPPGMRPPVPMPWNMIRMPPYMQNVRPPPMYPMPNFPNFGYGFPPRPMPMPRQPQQFPQRMRQELRPAEPKDEYAGLMTMREKQWLLNIQMLQVNTGTPYFDDYYYTVFKERKAKGNEGIGLDKNGRVYRQNRENTLTPRIYTPLQFENSLGKLQCGSVTAPRKIIDMDIVTPEKDDQAASRDTRKTKQLLLELESMYALLLKAEDLKNPLAIANLEKLREIKQKQRLRELELAPTPEQKQEVLRLFKLESQPVVEHQYDYINKILTVLLNEEKFVNFLSIRKGKTLLLRLLPHLSGDCFGAQLCEMWRRILLSLPITGRRDQIGDNIFPKLHPFFKRFIQSCTMSDVLDLVTGLVEVVRLESSNRSTPLSHQGKAPLYFVLLNKFGVSALATILIRTEYLISSEAASEKQQQDWSNFLLNLAELMTVVDSKVAAPLETIPSPIMSKHCNRFRNLTETKAEVLQKHFACLN